jgi:hypothetical protein
MTLCNINDALLTLQSLKYNLKPTEEHFNEISMTVQEAFEFASDYSDYLTKDQRDMLNGELGLEFTVEETSWVDVGRLRFHRMIQCIKEIRT